MANPVFKPYNPDQVMLLPPSLDELIPAQHPVRVVRSVVDQVNIDLLLKKYSGGGASSYDPRMMLKVLIYAYLSNVYSSRKIEAALQENIYFMWLSGMQQPDHNTVNRFRSNKLKGVLKEVFRQVVILLVESGHLDLQHIFTDGTKLEANANKYTFVWGKTIKKSKERIEKQLEELWSYAEGISAEELKDTRPHTFEAVDPQQVEQTIEKINKALQDKPVDKKVKQKLNYAKKNWPKKVGQYKEQEQILGQRNSYSKTDKDATFMRMKEDHMKNGQLKPGYNLQISTQSQFIVNYSLHQKPTDTTTLLPHLAGFKSLYGTLPASLTADAGYGSEENYHYLEKNNVEAYVKYNYFHKEQKELKQKQGKVKDPFRSEKLYYNPEEDYVVCPMGQKMHRTGTRIRKTATGYLQESAQYQAQNCQGCPLRPLCHNQSKNRVVELNHKLLALKALARKRLLSPTGLQKRSQRPVDVEPVFGMLKHNRHFKRFQLRTLPKVEVETGLLAIAHNLGKLFALHTLRSELQKAFSQLFSYYFQKEYKPAFQLY
jgi:transposase